MTYFVKLDWLSVIVVDWRLKLFEFYGVSGHTSLDFCELTCIYKCEENVCSNH